RTTPPAGCGWCAPMRFWAILRSATPPTPAPGRATPARRRCCSNWTRPPERKRCNELAAEIPQGAHPPAPAFDHRPGGGPGRGPGAVGHAGLDLVLLHAVAGRC